MKYLITGSSGFVGAHYIEYLSGKHPKATIIGVDTNRRAIRRPMSCSGKIIFYKKSLLDKDGVKHLVKKHKPSYIINLASYSSVAYSWKDPSGCFVNNTSIFLNLVEAVREANIKPRILSIGSSEEYGVVKKKDLPLKESALLRPSNPYAVARVAQEHISKVYAGEYKIPIICTRSFNHIGPGQRDIFAVSSFAKQIIEAKTGKRKKISCGNLNAIRDFMDVRDVVRAYELLLKKGTPGEAYNVCSGRGHRLSAILEMLQNLANTKFPVDRNTSRMRPVDSPVIIGCNSKLKHCTGFREKYPLIHSLSDILEYWRSFSA